MSYIPQDSRTLEAIQILRAALEAATPYRFGKLSDAIYHTNGSQWAHVRRQVFKALNGRKAPRIVEGRKLFHDFAYHLGAGKARGQEEKVELVDQRAAELLFDGDEWREQA